MYPKILTESGWKTVVQKNKLKDSGLQKALANFETTADKSPGDGVKALTTVIQLATALKKDKDVAAQAAVVKYVTDLLAGAVAEQKELAKDQAEAEKTAAIASKKAQVNKNADSEADEQEDKQADFGAKLLAAFQKLRGSKDLVYEFIVCDAKPHCGLMLAKKITGKEKDELTRVTGSKHFLHTGTCAMVDGKFTFTTDQVASGLAKKLQDAIKNWTDKKLPIVVGNESAEGDEQQVSAQTAARAPAGPMPPPKLDKPTLAKAPEVWHGTRNILDTNINHLKQAIRAEYANDGPEMLANIEQTVSKLDVILEKLDHRLAESLAKAAATNDATARVTELKNSKAILTDYLKYVKSEPLIAHIDANPLGIPTNIKQVLTESLTHMAQSIG